MKLGEALNERSRLSKRVVELRDAIDGSVIVQEGEDPAGDVQELITQSLFTIAAIGSLVAAINKTNSVTKLADGRTLTQAIADRDRLGAQVAMYDFIIRKLSKNDPYSFRRAASELKSIRLVELNDVVAKRDELALERRELDAELQTVNWTTELED